MCWIVPRSRRVRAVGLVRELGECAAVVAGEGAVAGGQMPVRFDELKKGLTDVFARDCVVDGWRGHSEW